MAKRQKKEEASQGSPAWMATFSDLMNLLLCFFVLLFSMSSVDQEKWEKVVASLSSSFSIFSGGQSSIGEGQLINMGVAQLNEFDEYFSNMGQTVEDTEGEEVKELKEQLMDMNKEQTDEMLDQISEMTSLTNLDRFVELSYDEDNYNYVVMSIKGNLLYNSGKVNFKDDGLAIFSKVGDILKHYSDCRISIIGHTDSVPVVSGKYRNNNELSAARAIYAAEYLMNVKKLSPSNLEWVGRGEFDPIADNKTEEGRSLNRRIEIRIYNKLNSEE